LLKRWDLESLDINSRMIVSGNLARLEISLTTETRYLLI